MTPDEGTAQQPYSKAELLQRLRVIEERLFSDAVEVKVRELPADERQTFVSARLSLSKLILEVNASLLADIEQGLAAHSGPLRDGIDGLDQALEKLEAAVRWAGAINGVIGVVGKVAGIAAGAARGTLSTDGKYSAVAARSPVELARTETERGEPQEGIALCLSGGGYRAMLFHLGALWRLNEFGLVGKLDRISSVSGGSITAATLAANWDHLAFDSNGVATSLNAQVVDPIRNLAGKTIDVPAILLGVLGPGGAGDRIAGRYRKHLYGDRTLQDLPNRPLFVINAASQQSGVLWRFSKQFMWDYRVGKVERPTTPLATAVAASSAFPPFLSPVKIPLGDGAFTPNTGDDLQRAPYTTNAILTDGGVYDNLGLETAWKRYRTILVSDGGGQMKAEDKPKRDWPRQGLRVLGMIDNQVRSLRKRQLIASYRADARDGAYWGIRSHIVNYGLSDTLPCPHNRMLELASTPTRLKALDSKLQERLINWGYAICDAAVRRHVDERLPAPVGFPYPAARI